MSDKTHEIDEHASASPSSSGGGSATKAAPKPRPAPPKADRLPPFRVLLHNDDTNDMIHVVRSIVDLTPLVKEDAVHRTLEAHNTGVSLLLVTHKERAELYREQFQSRGLVVTIEPAD